MSAEPHYIAPSAAAQQRRMEKRTKERSIRLKQWVSAHPLSTWHDSPTIAFRRRLDGTIARCPIGGKELRAHTSGDQFPIAPPTEPYPDPV